MSAPRKIWTDHGSDEWTYGAANAYDSPYEPSLHLYHHDDVVRELVEALERAERAIDCALPLTDSPTTGQALILVSARGKARAALAKIAQEDQG